MIDGKIRRPKTSDRKERRAAKEAEEAKVVSKNKADKKAALSREFGEKLAKTPQMLLAVAAVNRYATIKGADELMQDEEFRRFSTLLAKRMQRTGGDTDSAVNGYIHFEIQHKRKLMPGKSVTLYHGTTPAHTVNILEEGFIPSVTGLLGPGLYIGPIEKALNYLRPARVQVKAAIQPTSQMMNTSEFISIARVHGISYAKAQRRAQEEAYLKNARSQFFSPVEASFSGIIFEVEAVLGNTVTIESRYPDYLAPFPADWTTEQRMSVDMGRYSLLPQGAERYNGIDYDTFHGKAGVTPAGWGGKAFLERNEYCVRRDIDQRVRVIGARLYTNSRCF